MYDLREHKELISRLVSEANQNDPNWEWSVRRLSKNVACIFWGYLEYCDEAELSFSIKLGEADGRCWVEARNEHGWILESEIVADKNLPFLNCPIDKAIERWFAASLTPLMPATESIARRYAADIGFAVVGELTRKPEWDGVASDPEIGLSGYCRVWVDEGGNAYYVHGKECAIIDPEGMVY